MTKMPIAVLGTGMAGFGAGHALHSAGASFVCYDKNSYYGGHTRSIHYESGFVFDEGVHISFTKHDRIKELLASNIGGEYEERTFAIDNYWRGHRIPHPAQCNLRGLPTDLIIRIVRDFMVARIQSSKTEPNEYQNSSRASLGAGKQQTYSDWLYSVYGRTFADTFPIPYGQKYHTTSMDRLTTDWIGPRMYQPSIEDILRGVIEEPSTATHYIQTYRYPSKGGFAGYLRDFAEKFDIRLNHRLVGIDPYRKMLRFSNGTTHGYSNVISSIPLPELIPLIESAPAPVIEASRRLAFSSVVLFNIGVDRADLSNAATTYFYDEDVIFSRVNLPHMFARANAPPECGAIQAEVYFSDKYKPLTAAPESLMERVLNELRRCGLLRSTDNILMMDTLVNRYANVIYDHDRAEALSTVHNFLDDVNILYCGRYGDWNHAWTDEAFISGEDSAKKILQRQHTDELRTAHSCNEP